MADFCKQCSEENFGEDSKDLAGLGDGTKLKSGYGWPALCEGCGIIIVNDIGECISETCHKHGKLYPVWFVDREGGTWQEWKAGATTEHKMKAAVVVNHGVLNDVVFHALAFENPSAGHGNFARWDCINGWTTTLTQARKRFPNGLHNQPRK